MLTPQTSILLYGRDAQLLEIRRWVLERSGARVWTATHLSTFDLVAAAVSIDLIIFCHSLSMEDCGRAFALADVRWPHVRLLVLTSSGGGCHPGFSEQVADTALGPAHLLNTVERLVGAVHVGNSHAI